MRTCVEIIIVPRIKQKLYTKKGKNVKKCIFYIILFLYFHPCKLNKWEFLIILCSAYKKRVKVIGSHFFIPDELNKLLEICCNVQCNPVVFPFL